MTATGAGGVPRFSGGDASFLSHHGDRTKWKIRLWEQILPDFGFDRIEAAARILQCATYLTAAMDRIARSEGLANQGDYQALSVLRLAHHTGHHLTATDIATSLDDTTATTTNRLSRLERLGYAQRDPHPTDRRSVYVTITPDGAASVERMVVARTQQREQWLAALTDQQRHTLTSLLARLTT